MKPFVKHLIGVNLSVSMLVFLLMGSSLESNAYDSTFEVYNMKSATGIQTSITEIKPNIESEPETIIVPSAIPETERPVETAKPTVVPETVMPIETTKPTATPETEKPVETAKPTVAPETQKPVATKKPTNKPASKSTAKPQITYTEVNKITVANDKIAEEIHLDNKVPQNLKTTYTTLKNALEIENISTTGEQIITFSTGITEEELKDTLYYVESYNPQFFHINWGKYKFTAKGDKVVSVKLNCTLTITEYKALENKVNQLVAEANQKSSLFERELYIHDWMVKNITYDNSTENGGNIYGALVEGRAKCEGYAKAFQYLMNKIGIETVLITGTVDGSHMWNMVKLYGEYYFVDVTHDDPKPDLQIADGEEYLINRSCFNKNADVLGKTHTADAKGSRGKDGLLRNVDLQNCTATQYGYYQVEGTAVSNMSQMKYVLNGNKTLQTAEIFFQGDMPEMNQLKAAFKEFMADQYPDKAYSYNYTSQSSATYERNVIRFTWTIE